MTLPDPPAAITVLSGGVGGARFLQGLLHALERRGGASHVTVVANTADDIWLHGLKVCPDLDTVMYTLGGGIDAERGWGRTDETWQAKEELAAYGVEPTWFGLGDRDLATHLVRTQMLEAGYPLSAVTRALCERWQPGVTLLPMSDDRVESHIVIDDPAEPSGRRAVHFQEYWVRLHAEVPARAVVPVGIEASSPGPGRGRGHHRGRPGGGAAVQPGRLGGHDPGRARDAGGRAGHLRAGRRPLAGRRRQPRARDGRPAADRHRRGGQRGRGGHPLRRPQRPRGVLDGWLVDTADAGEVERVRAAGIECRAVPLMMTDLEATAAMADEVLAWPPTCPTGRVTRVTGPRRPSPAALSCLPVDGVGEIGPRRRPGRACWAPRSSCTTATSWW